MTHRLLRVIALGCALAIVSIAAAFAQSPGDIVNAVCSPQGQSLALWLLGVVGVGTVLTWAKTRLAGAPPWVQAIVHFCAGNWPTVLKVLRSGAALVLAIILAASLTACSGTSVNLAPISPADAQLMFKNACAGISTANGMFQADAPALIVAGKLTQAQIDQEKSIFALASGRCDNPPVDASGQVNYQLLAIDTAGDAAAVYLLLSGK
jgi:hypothetical protein